MLVLDVWSPGPTFAIRSWSRAELVMLLFSSAKVGFAFLQLDCAQLDFTLSLHGLSHSELLSPAWGSTCFGPSLSASDLEALEVFSPPQGLALLGLLLLLVAVSKSDLLLFAVDFLGSDSLPLLQSSSRLGILPFVLSIANLDSSMITFDFSCPELLFSLQNLNYLGLFLPISGVG